MYIFCMTLSFKSKTGSSLGRKGDKERGSAKGRETGKYDVIFLLPGYRHKGGHLVLFRRYLMLKLKHAFHNTISFLFFFIPHVVYRRIRVNQTRNVSAFACAANLRSCAIFAQLLNHAPIKECKLLTPPPSPPSQPPSKSLNITHLEWDSARMPLSLVCEVLISCR